MEPRDRAKRWLFVIVAWVIVNIIGAVFDYLFIKKLGMRSPSVIAPSIVCLFLLNDWYERMTK
jgi:undecaprenyl pyrophosphate phosphatase UppP